MKYYQKAVSTPGIPYYTYEEMQQDLAALQAEYPAFLQHTLCIQVFGD